MFLYFLYNQQIAGDRDDEITRLGNKKMNEARDLSSVGNKSDLVLPARISVLASNFPR